MVQEIVYSLLLQYVLYSLYPNYNKKDCIVAGEEFLSLFASLGVA